MAKRRNSWIIVLTVMCLFSLCLTALAGCSKDDPKNTKHTVTFMIKNMETGKYEEFKKLETDAEGNVELPIPDEQKGYAFRDWYKDEACTQRFDGKNVTEDMTVYAYISDKILTITIKDEKGKLTEMKEQTVASLTQIEKEQSEIAENKNLSFRGWYTNEDCTTPYDNTSEATKVYACYKAKVVFNNGYEDLTVGDKGEKEIYVVPGQTITRPDTAKIRKDYMAEDDIYFVNYENNLEDYNFKNPINENTVIRVLWKTKGLEFKAIEGTNDYMFFGFQRGENGFISDKDLVVSIPSRITVENQEVRVVSVNLGNITTAAPSANKIIINDGIKYVSGMNGGVKTTPIKEVVLPKTLVILENSFNDLDLLESIEIPSGTEIILDCFWEDYELTGNRERNNGYDFDILIPNTVKNLAMVPLNVKFEEGSPFAVEGNFVIKNDSVLGKTLVSAPKACIDDTKTILIPEGFKAIQVGIFSELNYKYLNLPSTFEKAAYNCELADYPYYTGNRLFNPDDVVNPDTDPAVSKKMGTLGYAIVDNLTSHELVIFNSATYPEGMNKYTFCDRNKPYDAIGNTRFIAQIATGEPVKIDINYANKMAGDSVKNFVIDTVSSGETVSLDDIIKAAGITVNDVIKVKATTQFDKPFDFSKPITTNVYIDIELYFDTFGVKVEENEDGTLTVVGFDKSSAYALPNGISYLVSIPDIYNGKKIVAIKDGAFENCSELGQIFIANTIKSIGKKSFCGCENLELVSIAKGGLETIGEKAFEGAGAVEVDYTGDAYKAMGLKKIWQVNPELSGAGIELVIRLPLSNLKEVGPYAFNTPALKQFTVAAGEEERPVFQASFNFENAVDNYNPGEFYFQQATAGFGSKVRNMIIFKMGDGKAQKIGEGETAITVYDYEIYATAAGLDCSGLAFGSNHKAMHGDYFYRATVKTGSVALYNTGSVGMFFGYVKNIEENAFVFVDEYFIKANEKGQNMINTSSYIDLETLKAQTNSEGVEFADKWFMGQTNDKNTFMANAYAGGGGIPGMVY